MYLYYDFETIEINFADTKFVIFLNDKFDNELSNQKIWILSQIRINYQYFVLY